MAIGGLSNSYDFNPSTGEIVVQAFNMIGIRPTALLAEHMESARMAVNLLLARWSAQTPNLWSVDLQTVPLVAGQSAYDVPANTVTMLDAYIVVGAGAQAVNRIILPVSRTEYASYPKPQQAGSVTVFWFDRLLSPVVNLYYTPDSTQISLCYYRVRRAMDAGFRSGQQVEVPYYFLESLVAGLAYRLAIIWAPEKAMALKSFADESYEISATQNTEAGSTYITPLMSSYWRA